MTTDGDGNLPEPVVALREHEDALIQMRLAFIEGQLPFGYRFPAIALDAHVRESTGRIFASPHHHVLVHPGTRSEGGLVGYAIGLRKLVPGLAVNRIGKIEELYVVPEFRRAGVGCRLQEALVQKMIRLGVDRVELEVLALNNTAVRFWLDHGYTTHHHVLVRETSDL